MSRCAVAAPPYAKGSHPTLPRHCHTPERTAAPSPCHIVAAARQGGPPRRRRSTPGGLLHHCHAATAAEYRWGDCLAVAALRHRRCTPRGPPRRCSAAALPRHRLAVLPPPHARGTLRRRLAAAPPPHAGGDCRSAAPSPCRIAAGRTPGRTAAPLPRRRAAVAHWGGGALHCCRANAPQRHRSDVAADTPVERQHTPRVAATLRRCRALGITTVSLSRPTSRAAARQGYLPRLRLAAAPPPYARGGVATLPLASRRCHTPEGAVTLSPCYRAAAKHQENRRNVA